MNLHNLKPAKGSTKKVKRIGRGEGSGHGGTSTRGYNGAQSRSGYKAKRGHEGGQTPIQRRLPKRGFKNLNRIEFQVFNLSSLSDMAVKYATTVIDVDFLVKNHIVGKTEKVKILGNGELKSAVSVKAHAFSAKAKETIEAKGGKAETI